MNRYHQYCEDVWNNARWHYNTVAYWYPYVKNVPMGGRDLMIARGILLGTAAKLTSVHLMEYTCGQPIERTDTADKKKISKTSIARSVSKYHLGWVM